MNVWDLKAPNVTHVVFGWMPPFLHVHHFHIQNGPELHFENWCGKKRKTGGGKKKEIPRCNGWDWAVVRDTERDSHAEVCWNNAAVLLLIKALERFLSLSLPTSPLFPLFFLLFFCHRRSLLATFFCAVTLQQNYRALQLIYYRLVVKTDHKSLDPFILTAESIFLPCSSTGIHTDTTPGRSEPRHHPHTARATRKQCVQCIDQQRK